MGATVDQWVQLTFVLFIQITVALARDGVLDVIL